MRLLATICIDSPFECLSGFVAFRATFNDLCCWTERCGLLSRIHLCGTDRSWRTGPNEFLLHFQIVFVVCWHQVEKFVQVVFYRVWLFCSIYTKIRHRFVYWRHWSKSCFGNSAVTSSFGAPVQTSIMGPHFLVQNVQLGYFLQYRDRCVSLGFFDDSVLQKHFNRVIWYFAT